MRGVGFPNRIMTKTISKTKNNMFTSLLSLNCATATTSCETHLLEIAPCALIQYYSMHELLKVATVHPVLIANAHRWKIQLDKDSER